MSRYVTLIYFLLGCLVAALLLVVPTTHHIFDVAGRLGYLTAFIGGLLYSSSFSAATGALLLTHVSNATSPVLAAIIAGSGGLMYDLLLFNVVNREMSHRPVLRHLVDWFQRHRQLRWAGLLAGGFVIASPFPDELGIALMDGVGTSQRWFIPLAFGLNVLGMFAIIEVF